MSYVQLPVPQIRGDPLRKPESAEVRMGELLRPPGAARAGKPSAVDAPRQLREPLAAAAPPQRDDLRRDRHRRLLRGAGTEIEADRRRQPVQLRLGDPG